MDLFLQDVCLKFSQAGGFFIRVEAGHSTPASTSKLTLGVVAVDEGHNSSQSGSDK